MNFKVLSIESETGFHQRKGQVRKSIKNLFGSTPKFQKSMKRGIYLASLLYNDDRILVTNDEILPIVEIGQSFTFPYINYIEYFEVNQFQPKSTLKIYPPIEKPRVRPNQNLLKAAKNSQ